jgi:hypothetical protein
MPKRVRTDRSPYCLNDPSFGSVYASPKARLASDEDILNYLDEHQIDKAVVFGFPWEDIDLIRMNNDEVLDFHARHPDRIIPFAVLPPYPGEQFHREAERAVTAGFFGLGELAKYATGWSASDFHAMRPTLDLAADARCPILIHVNEPVGHKYQGKIEIDFQALLSMIEHHPDNDFILAHWGGGLFFYALMPEVGRVLRRTYFDTAASPFLYSPDIVPVAVRIVGPGKIAFGSDFPLLTMKRYRRHFEESGIDEETTKLILGDTIGTLLLTER